MGIPKKILLFGLVIFNIHHACSQHSVSLAVEHFNKFNNVQGGWLASDATISLLLPDGNTLWLFGDCVIGERKGTFVVDTEHATMINNAAIIEKDGMLAAYYQGTMENPFPLIPKEGEDIFWPEHATIENDTIKIFAIRIILEDLGVPGFNFRVGTTHMAYFKYPGMEYIRTEEIKYITDSTMRFGTHVLEKDGYKYIYGKKDTVVDGLKYPLPMLARVVESVEEPWQFYAGDSLWSYDCSKAKPIGDRPMSESFFVYEKGSKYYMIMHEIWLIGELFILEADELTGPWNRAGSGGVENKFAVIRPHGQNFTYNLFAHPHFLQDGNILISFNVNSRDFGSIFKDTRNYRARFYWLDVDQAVSTSVPDTLDIFEPILGIPDPGSSQKQDGPRLRNDAHNLYIENIRAPSVLEIYSLEGSKYYSGLINEDKAISLTEFPRAILIVRLTGETEPRVCKILNLF